MNNYKGSALRAIAKLRQDIADMKHTIETGYFGEEYETVLKGAIEASEAGIANLKKVYEID